MMGKSGILVAGLAGALAVGPALAPSAALWAQASAGGTVTLEATAQSPRPRARPESAAAPANPAAPPAAAEDSVPAKAAKPARDPSKGAVTSLPIPRYVSLKGNEGNARRGPALTHRIDWVFTTAGMPLRITAEHENWRRVEDAEGMGGWVHYSLLSGVRSVLVSIALADFRDTPDLRAAVAFQAERGVIGRLLECLPDWCRVNIDGEKGWVRKEALWGVEAGEVVE
jgi:SH3-like domain-containing protein